jgi:hypothetical protein
VTVLSSQGRNNELSNDQALVDRGQLLKDMGSARHAQRLNRIATSQQIIQLRTRLQAILDIYVKHRPNVQRALTAGFVAYCLGTTWMSLTGRGARGGTRERGAGKKGKGKGKGVDGEWGGFLQVKIWNAESPGALFWDQMILWATPDTQVYPARSYERRRDSSRRRNVLARANIPQMESQSHLYQIHSSSSASNAYCVSSSHPSDRAKQ